MPVAGPPATVGGGAGLSFADVMRIFRQRIFLILFMWIGLTAVTVAVTYYCSKRWYTYRSVGYVQVKSPNRQKPMQISDAMVGVEIMNRYVSDQMQIIKNPGTLSEALKATDVKETTWYINATAQSGGETGPLLDELIEDLRVSQVQNTNFIAISFATGPRGRAEAPQKHIGDSAVIVNTVLEKYMVRVQEDLSSGLQGEQRGYQAELTKLSQDLANARKRKNEFIATFSTPGVTEGLNVVGERFRSLSAEVTRLEAEKLAAKAQFENLRALTTEQMVLDPNTQRAIQSDPQVMNLNAQLLGLQQERDMLLRRVGGTHRSVVELNARLEGLQDTLDRLVTDKEEEARTYMLSLAENAYQNAMQAEVKLREQLVAEEAKQTDIDQKLAEYRSREEEVNQLQEQYNELLGFTRQLEMMGSNTEVAQLGRIPATAPREQDFPRWEFMVPTGSFLGLLVGIGLALLLELMDTSLRTPRDIARHVHIPMLGTVPDVDDEEVRIDKVEMASLQAPRSMVAEAFRSVRTNLLLSAPAERQRTLLVASAKPEEGRTTVATNLAMSIAQSGRRVLLVDANFHRPALQNLFPTAAGRGLSNILVGQATLPDLVRTTDLPNLDVLGSGPIPPNPTELLSGSYLRDMINVAQQQYDQIIFDGPPILLVSDALVLSGIVDGVVLVCRARSTSRGVAQRGREQIERVNGRIFGAVLNAAQAARGGYYREQIRTYYEYQPEEALAASSTPILPRADGDKEK